MQDTGIGIQHNNHAFIFDLFRQVEESHTRSYDGLGIGLSICKKLAHLLGGQIWLESEKGKGSKFYFTIPLILNRNSNNEDEQKLNICEESSKDIKHKTILIVEDNDSSYEYINTILKTRGMKFLRAVNGEKAIKYCKENQSIDLVLMDMNMPVMNGFQATKAIKKFKPDLPIIAQTAYAIVGDKEKSLKIGCDDYISKPFNKEELLKKIENCLNCK